MLAILLPDQPEEDTKASIDTMLGHITEQNGTINSVSADSPWGRRRLAYTIRHEGVDYRDGHYVLVYFTAMPSALTEIERDLKLDTNVIRYLLLINDPEMGEKFDESQVAETEGEDAEAEAAPAEETSTEEPAAEAAPAEESAAEESAADEAPATEEDAAEEAPVEEPATDAADTQEAAAEEATEE